MSLSDIRTQLKSIVESVDGVGKVHDYDRWTTDWNTLRQLFIDDQNRLNGWVITCPQSNENLQSLSVNIRKHLIKIEGIYGQKDSAESEKLFRDMLEKVCNKLRENNDLNKSCMRCDPPKVAKVVRRRFAGILAHVGEIHLTADEYIRYNPI